MMSHFQRMGRIFAVAAAAVLLGTPAEAYYHYIHFLNLNGSLAAIPEAFDLNALPNNTITFLVSDTGPATFAANDSFGSILSQIRQAAAAWNSVPTSDLRVAFGGLETNPQSSVSKTPGADVVFQDLSPGLLGLGAPVVSATATVSAGQNGPFLPVSRGMVILTNNTNPNRGPGPSNLEAYYTTAVHEFGHALGLQHTWTASAMSQDVIRNTSRARPLDADDMAALSVLYGKAGWAASLGSISGRVTAGNQPVPLASVVAIPPTGPAVSALTNPDGTYTISGLPPNQYLLYVHPLPPDAINANNTGIALPKDAGGNALPGPSGFFQTVFYPGTTDPQKAATFTVDAGTSPFTNQNFAVQARSSVPAYDIVTYSFLDPSQRTYTDYGSIAITPAYLDVTRPHYTIVAQPNVGAMPNLTSVTALGNIFNSTFLSPYGSGVALYFFPGAAAPAPGARHLVFDFGSDIYVLPDAINLVAKGPPQIDSQTLNNDGSVTVAGAGLGADTRVYFDGLPAAVVAPFAGAAAQGSITVNPPPGTSGQVSLVAVFNSDGQNSMFLQPAAPPQFVYAASPAPLIVAVNPPSLAAGSSPTPIQATIDITTANTNFVEGQVSVGFGTSDIAVGRIWVLSANHLVANVVVAPNATVGASELSVVSGFQVMSQPSAFQIQPVNPALPAIAFVLNGVTNLPGPFNPSGYVTLYGTNLAPSPANLQLALNGAAIPVLYASATQINFQIPASFSAGSATLNLNNGAASAFPVRFEIDNPPPAIAGVSVAGAAVDATHPANPGDVLSVLATGLDPAAAAGAGRVQVTVSGVPMTVQQITPAPAGAFQIQFALSQSFGGAQVPLVVAVDGSPSAPFLIAAR